MPCDMPGDNDANNREYIFVSIWNVFLATTPTIVQLGGQTGERLYELSSSMTCKTVQQFNKSFVCP